MNTVPKAHPPATMCHQNGTAKYGLVAEPMKLNRLAIAIVPAATPVISRHEPTPVAIRMTAPTRQASADVSPIDPFSKPTKACHQDRLRSAIGPVAWRICESTVAPEKPSTATLGGTAVHT